MPISENERLARQISFPFARTTAGVGTAWMFCSVGAAEYFRLHDLPRPQDDGVSEPSGGYRLMSWPDKLGRMNGLNLRIAYAWSEGSKKPSMARFRLGGDPVMDTVQVVVDHLNASGVEWLWICNRHGNRLSRSAFHSDGLAVRGRACS